jgi:hypothetical protein
MKTEQELKEEFDQNFISDEKKRNKERSSQIKETWDNPRIFKARTTRNHVFVQWFPYESVDEFKSVAHAFNVLGLPLYKHSRFRTKLKKVGALDFVYNGKTYKFEVKK